LGAVLADTNCYSFQWLSNGVALTGATSPVLSFGDFERSNSGWYTLVVSNVAGYSVQLNALVRALVPPLLEAPQLDSNSVVHLFFQDADGGLPYDLTKAQFQWRTNWGSGSWQTLTSTLYTNGAFLGVDDTNSAPSATKFYRVLEQ
jgi:hypothetical protein